MFISFGQAMRNNNTLWTCSWVWALGKSISGDAQYVTLRKYCSHSSLDLYSLATPPLKVKLGQQMSGGPINSKSLGPIIMMGNQKHWAAIRSYLLHSFMEVHSAAAPFTRHSKVRNSAEPKPFSWAIPA